MEVDESHLVAKDHFGWPIPRNLLCPCGLTRYEANALGRTWLCPLLYMHFVFLADLVQDLRSDVIGLQSEFPPVFSSIHRDFGLQICGWPVTKQELNEFLQQYETV